MMFQRRGSSLWTRSSVEDRLKFVRNDAGLPAQFAAYALLQTPVALRAVMDAYLPGDLTLAQLVTSPPARRGAVWDGHRVLPAFMVIRFTEGDTAGTAGMRKALAAFRDRPNGQVPHPADHAKTEVWSALFLRHVYRQSLRYCQKREARWRATQRSLAAQ
jgi:hypothetical protein